MVRGTVYPTDLSLLTNRWTYITPAMIGIPGYGLGVEARKRVTIGVELAAKPQLLLFLDGWSRDCVSERWSET